MKIGVQRVGMPFMHGFHIVPPDVWAAMSIIRWRLRRYPRFHKHGYYYGLYTLFKTG